MDNIAHTLVGGALARTGFDKRTPLATATMMIGANFPDIDVASVPFGADLAIRRGVTHGIPAHIILPFVLAGIMLAWDKWVRRRRDPSLAPAVPREILLLSAISIATHPFLDWCNSYGMRWLMPMKNEWFYGDTLFIADLWLWIALFFGFRLSRMRASTQPARIAIAFTAVYIAGMMIETTILRRQIEGEAHLTRRALMVAPVAINPFARQVVLVQDGVYRTGRWSPTSGMQWREEIPINRDDPDVARALADPDTRAFMSWSRFPFFIVNRAADGSTTVHIADARYNDRFGGGWASITVPVTP